MPGISGALGTTGAPGTSGVPGKSGAPGTSGAPGKLKKSEHQISTISNFLFTVYSQFTRTLKASNVVTVIPLIFCEDKEPLQLPTMCIVEKWQRRS